MGPIIDSSGSFPVVGKLEEFDTASGGPLERMIFNHRRWIVLAVLIVSALLTISASKLSINASFESMIPQSHPYIRNYLDNRDALRGLGNSVRIIVESKSGTIFDADYIGKLKKI